MTAEPNSLFLKQMLVGPMANFTYLIGCPEKRECLVVDPAWDIDAIVAAAQREGYTIKGALVTHYHPDHCGGHLWGHDIEGVAELVGKLSVPVYANEHEIAGLQKITGLDKTDFRSCKSGDVVKVGTLEVKTIHTPGHTPGSQCFLLGNNLVSGDTLFISGCGRVDLPGGDADQLFETLNTKLSKIDSNAILYPGHNYDDVPSLDMGAVRMRNPYLRVKSIDEWHRFMGH